MTQPVHFHPSRKGGLKPNDPRKPRLKLRRVGAVRSVPDHPLASEMFTGVSLAMDLNDRFGTCVPTGLDNLRRMVTLLLTGTQQSADISDIVSWYRTQNPEFDPYVRGGVQDEGMVIQDFLSWCVKAGLIIGFAEIDEADDEMLKAANYLAMGPMNGALLTEAQVGEQYDRGRWDYVPGDREAGGHCFVTGAYSADDGAEEDCATWQKRVQMTVDFLNYQRSEAWAVIFPAHLSNPTFREHFDLAKLAEAIEEITGRPAPFDVTPNPEPSPEPVSPAPGGEGWFRLDPETVVAVGRWAKRHKVALPDAPNQLLKRSLHIKEEKG